jgi:hypothetical protein
MSAVCVECGFVNPPAARFCGECGVELVISSSEGTFLEVNTPNPPPLSLPPGLPVYSMKTMPPPLDAGSTRNFNKFLVRPEPKFAMDRSGTFLQKPAAYLIHLATGEHLEIPLDRMISYIGKPNEDIPPDIDIAHLPDTDIVSRIHAAIHVQGLRFFLEDAGSSNGTYLNGELLKAGARYRRPLTPGDTVTLGRGSKVAFTFDLKET